jgi:hypothetical protein
MPFHHGVEHVDLPPQSAGVHSTGQLANPVLRDVQMSQFIQGKNAKLGNNLRERLLLQVLKLAVVTDRILRMSMRQVSEHMGLTWICCRLKCSATGSDKKSSSKLMKWKRPLPLNGSAIHLDGWG